MQGKFTLYSSALPPKATVLFKGDQVPSELGGLCLGEKATFDGLWLHDQPDGLGVFLFVRVYVFVYFCISACVHVCVSVSK